MEKVNNPSSRRQSTLLMHSVHVLWQHHLILRHLTLLHLLNNLVSYVNENIFYEYFLKILKHSLRNFKIVYNGYSMRHYVFISVLNFKSVFRLLLCSPFWIHFFWAAYVSINRISLKYVFTVLLHCVLSQIHKTIILRMMYNKSKGYLLCEVI